MGHTKTDITNNTYTHFSNTKYSKAMNAIAVEVEKNIEVEEII